MNQKSNAAVTIDLKIHFKRELSLRDLVRWALPVLVAVVHYTARLHGGP